MKINLFSLGKITILVIAFIFSKVIWKALCFTIKGIGYIVKSPIKLLKYAAEQANREVDF